MPQTSLQHASHRSLATLAIAVLSVTLLTAACGPGAAEPGAAPVDTKATSATVASSPSDSGASASSASATVTPTTTTSTPSSSTTTTTTAPKTKPPSMLRPGDQSPHVLTLQQRLSDLGYWVGKPDGRYGNQTSQAVMAVQKAAGLDRDGVLGPRTQAALARGSRPTPRTQSGSAVEVDLKRQLVLVVQGGQLRLILNTSTGSGQKYTSDGVHYVAHTPRGKYRIQRQIDGLRVSRLGELWRPKYFFEGYALHGAPNVPGYPASHGCVRLSNAAIDMLWSSNAAPIGRAVWIY